MLIYGIGAAQNPDKVGEVIDINGIDTNELRFLNDEHGEKLSDMLGAIRKHKKIFSERDCENSWQKKCWQIAQVPFLYFEGEINEDPEHEDAKAAKSLFRFINGNPGLPLRIGGSVEGGIIERGGAEKKALNRTIAKGISLTVKPCNPKCQVFMAQDLQKSEPPATLPAKYQEALKKSYLTPSFKDIYAIDVLQIQLESLYKSILNMYGEFTNLKCKDCGHTDKFFKSTSNWPNHCDKCGQRFTMKDIYKALNNTTGR